MRFSLFPLVLVAVPLVEIAGFVLVGRQIGVLPTLGLVVATGIAGSILMRLQGFGVMARIGAELRAGRDPSRELVHGLLILTAGILLLIPGFVTDLLGILLFLAPVREFAWRRLRRRIAGVAGLKPFGSRHGIRTIDLDARDYSDRDKGQGPRRLDH